MNINDAEKAIDKADQRHEFDPVKWGENVNMTLKQVMKEGVGVYDWITKRAVELYQRVEDGHQNENTQRKLLDTMAKVTSLKINACMETMRIVGDIGKDEKTMQEKLAMIKEVIESPFAKVVLNRAQRLEEGAKGEDDDE